MKARSFKKFFVSIALSAVLTLSSASSVFAATAQLAPAEQSVEQLPLEISGFHTKPSIFMKSFS